MFKRKNKDFTKWRRKMVSTGLFLAVDDRELIIILKLERVGSISGYGTRGNERLNLDK